MSYNNPEEHELQLSGIERLPSEIRLKIWQITLPARVFTIRWISNHLRVTASPSILNYSLVNRQFYHDIQDTYLHDPAFQGRVNGGIKFNSSRDILFIPSAVGLVNFSTPFLGYSLALVTQNAPVHFLAVRGRLITRLLQLIANFINLQILYLEVPTDQFLQLSLQTRDQAMAAIRATIISHFNATAANGHQVVIPWVVFLTGLGFNLMANPFPQQRSTQDFGPASTPRH